MGSFFTPDKIKQLIRDSKSAEHYSDDIYDELDGEHLDKQRCIATSAQRILDKYFKRNPNDKIENYM